MSILEIVSKIFGFVFQSPEHVHSENFSKILEEFLQDLLKEAGEKDIAKIIKEKFQIQDPDFEEKLQKFIEELRRKEMEGLQNSQELAQVGFHLNLMIQSSEVQTADAEDIVAWYNADYRGGEPADRFIAHVSRATVGESISGKNVSDQMNKASEHTSHAREMLDPSLNNRTPENERAHGAEQQPSAGAEKTRTTDDQNEVTQLTSDALSEQSQSEKERKHVTGDLREPSSNFKNRGVTGDKASEGDAFRREPDASYSENIDARQPQRAEAKDSKPSGGFDQLDDTDNDPHIGNSKNTERSDVRKNGDLLGEVSEKNLKGGIPDKTQISGAPHRSDIADGRTARAELRAETPDHEKVQSIKSMIIDSIRLSISSPQKRAIVDTTVGGARVLIEVQVDLSNRVSVSIATSDATLRQEISNSYDDFRRFMQENEFVLARFNLSDGNERAGGGFQEASEFIHQSSPETYGPNGGTEKFSYGTVFANMKGRLNIVA